MLSLSPRYDLFRFAFPKTFLPEEIEQKYNNILNKNAGVITTPIDYLNESIQSITLPGISDVLMTQGQSEHNTIPLTHGRINTEAKHDINYVSTTNPLEKINKEFKVDFRLNQGLLNYFMLYETIFHYICRTHNREPIDVLFIELLDEDGVVISKISLFDVFIDGIDGLDFSYNKVERNTDTFSVTFKFNNIDFDFVYGEQKKEP